MTTSKVDWEDATRMFLNGSTQTEIALKYGVTRALVSHHFTEILNGRQEGFKRRINIPYVGIRNWINRNKLTYQKVAEMIFGDDVDRSGVTCLRRILIGATKNINIDIMRKLLEVSGLTFEEAFITEESKE